GGTLGGPEPRQSEYTGVVALALGDLSSCAASVDGVSCSGDNHIATLGDGSFEDSLEPVESPELACD
ncbi:MAG TPA: hypothetical protein VMZ28_03645, partial [Kofleriaceae bacterium]|nr:hypothetical protein [Kofleriaceae bacterium]